MGARVGFVENENLFKTGFKLHVIDPCDWIVVFTKISVQHSQFRTSFSQPDGAVCVISLQFTELFALYTSTFSTAKCSVKRVDSGKH